MRYGENEALGKRVLFAPQGDTLLSKPITAVPLAIEREELTSKTDTEAREAIGSVASGFDFNPFDVTNVFLGGRPRVEQN